MSYCSERWWSVQQGPGAVVATAIHNGHDLRPEVAEAIALSDFDRLREEDPFTGEAVLDVPAHIVVHRSRFEFDLNRPPDEAVYVTPDQSWGLKLWEEEPVAGLVSRSLAIHTDYYKMLGQLLDSMAARHGNVVLLDVHSYNHRRGGPDCDPTPRDRAPDINIGTFSMPRERWAFLVDPLIEALREFDFKGRKLNVRENVAFEGKGFQTRFVHERFPLRACALAFEFKKFYMDEWTGLPDVSEVSAMRRMISFVAAKCEELLS
ncbi:MAG TPA: N-formylglutamate amidohydrolase [Sphingomicrobium sp.]|jgi:hypothetical protein|nr:N-formylglutamate amidohydrolase [Sphingomicrobium sp.]